MLAAHLPNRNARVDLPKGIRYLLHRESRLSHRLVLSQLGAQTFHTFVCAAAAPPNIIELFAGVLMTNPTVRFRIAALLPADPSQRRSRSILGLARHARSSHLGRSSRPSCCAASAAPSSSSPRA